MQAREEAIRSKRRIESSTATSQREALLGLSRNDTARNTGSSGTSGTSKDDELMNATASVTDGLRRTRQLLEQELERSSLSTQMLGRLAGSPCIDSIVTSCLIPYIIGRTIFANTDPHFRAILHILRPSQRFQKSHNYYAKSRYN